MGEIWKMDFKISNSETGESEENWTLNRKEIERACKYYVEFKIREI